ncbi:MAG: hypothetical protein RLZZ142_1755 [Verrucomicrobiota bacterium]
MRLLLRLFQGAFRTLMLAVLLLGMVCVFANAWVLWIGHTRVLHHPSQIPPGSVGLVLGTSPRTGKHLNLFFEGRMNTAAKLYHCGALSHLVLSGDNRRADYNEPAAMREALRTRGVPDSALTLDYAGLRTLDSVIRARRIFQIEKPLIITDDFHQPRALFLAWANQIPALGFPSEKVSGRHASKTRLREWASRVLACLDVYLLETQPRFLGKAIPTPTTHAPDAAGTAPSSPTAPSSFPTTPASPPLPSAPSAPSTP